LVWSDYPAVPYAGVALVNDLDLQLTAPDGTTTYWGNAFSGGWSVTGGNPDDRNNVENVYIQAPVAGFWRVQVIGRNVPYGSQPFALVISANFGYSVYLPLVTRRTSGCGLVNCDFESGPSGWTEYSSHGYDVIVSSDKVVVNTHSGNYLAWLGGIDDEQSYIRQQVTISAGAPYLVYWHWIASEDACGFDFGGVLVNGSAVEVYDLCSSSSTGGWVKHSVNLSAYAGQSVTLQIRAETDAVLNSNLFVDDVSLQASPAYGQVNPIPEWDASTTLGKTGIILQRVEPLGMYPKRLFHPR
jgi:hypothetical protein